ncbi:MAG TPA: hypothetical protein VN903_30690 [Polyangia bacterium]|jgi:hypothetical protein|nr:hypothetical protein [Polyangia bacterium]
MFAMTALAPFVVGCAGPTDASDPVTESQCELRVIGDPGNPGVPTDPTPTPTRPTRPPTVPVVPQYSDLKPDGTMRAWTNGYYNTSVWLNVINIGNMEAKADMGSVTIAGYPVSGPLNQYPGGSATSAHTLNPGERGYISVEVPGGILKPCISYGVQIDTTRVMQGGTAGAPDSFANDQARVKVACLQWNTPINSDNYPFDIPLIAGDTLMEIVGSFKVGRPDGNVCSNCHYSGSGRSYSPPVAQGRAGIIWPTDDINGRTWAGPGGYARAFMARPTNQPDDPGSKPLYLQALVQRWIIDGELVSSELTNGDPLPITIQ